MKLMACIAGVAATLASGDIVERTFPVDPGQETGSPDITGFSPSGEGFIRLDTDTNLLEWEVNYQGLTGNLNGAALATAVNEIIRRHQVLQMSVV